MKEGEIDLMYYVDALISKSNDIMEQIKIIKEHKDHPEVKLYLELLDETKLSPYMRWIVDKYLFDRKVGKKPKKSYDNVKLFAYYVPEYESKQPILTLEIYVKVGDKVVLRQFYERGIYDGMEAKIIYIKNSDIITVQYELFDQKVIVDIPSNLIGGVINE